MYIIRYFAFCLVQFITPIFFTLNILLFYTNFFLHEILNFRKHFFEKYDLKSKHWCKKVDPYKLEFFFLLFFPLLDLSSDQIYAVKNNLRISKAKI